MSADEKLVSLFEPHTDIIVTSQGEAEFGHKLMLTGLIALLIDHPEGITMGGKGE